MDKAQIAVDIGGTFTDVVLQSPTGQRISTKLLTTYRHPGEAVLKGMAQVLLQAVLQPQDIGLIIHGTTLATNALIERRGAKTALLTTAGHRDSLAMAHEDRFEQYDINIDRPRPLVPRELRLPIRERLNHRGEVLLPLHEADIQAALPILDEHEVESLAIGYLHAYANPEHEQRSAEIISKARPDISLTLASEVCPEIREYERLSTACANAYVRPLMARYLHRLQDEIRERGFDCGFLLMTSGGGLTTLETAAKFPIRLVESGPAGGAILAREVAKEAEMPRLLSFDMGGTTAKLCLIDDYTPLSSRSFEVDRVYRFKKGSGLPVRIPVIEMVEIGAGGGSIAHVDKLGRLQVGPQSAASEPGPAAYGRGGTQAAVTDADVCQGKVPSENFAGGAFNLDVPAAQAAVEKHIAQPLQLNQDEAAFGISEVVDENMASAARAHAAEFGLDISARDMVAFGGAAPLHAARLGEKLGVPRILIPRNAGVGSAVGFLLAPVAFEVVRSRQQVLSGLDVDSLNQLLQDMYAEAEHVVRQADAQSRLIESRQAYMRYVGQGHEIAIDLPLGRYDAATPQELKTRFEVAYRTLYGQTIPGVEIEALSWTLSLSAEKPNTQNDARLEKTEDVAVAKQFTQLFDPTTQVRQQAPIYQRESLRPGQLIDGPALISEAQTTCVVTSCWQAQISPHGHIILSRKA